MPATLYYESDVDLGAIRHQKIAVLGYGNQGHAHALNARDNGLQVVVGLRTESPHRQPALQNRLDVLDLAEATKWADIVMFCTPDVPMADIYRTAVEPNLREGQLVLFAHGFNIRFGLIEPPAWVDVALVSPKGPGHLLRTEFVAGNGLAAMIAVHQDNTGTAHQRALGYAWAIGCARAGVLQTTFKEETETDLFGEQAVLCGGVPELIKAGFETLVEAGYQPEAAYFECLHEVKLIVDLLYARGLSGMREAISDTAEWGGFNAGPRVVTDASRQAMREILAEIQSGEFTRKWIEENRDGLPKMEAFRQAERAHPAEEVGARLRAMMPFIGARKPSP